MGGTLSKKMESIMKETTKENQEFMLASQRMQVGRQVQMQMQMRERMVAQQLAMARERLYWWGGFMALATVGLCGAAVRRKMPWIMGPLVPLSFVVGYQVDLAYGNKMERVIAEADSILANEKQLLKLPGVPLTIELIDREQNKGK